MNLMIYKMVIMLLISKHLKDIQQLNLMKVIIQKSIQNGLSTVGTIKDADNWTLDSGFYKTPSKYSLGDYVWYDSNKDGYQDDDEKVLKVLKLL